MPGTGMAGAIFWRNFLIESSFFMPKIYEPAPPVRRLPAGRLFLSISFVHLFLSSFLQFHVFGGA